MITSNINEVIIEFNAILMRMDDFVPVFEVIGHYVVGEVEARIMDTKLSPDNEHWAPWRPATAEIRFKQGNEEQGILWDTGALLSDLTLNIDGSIEMEVGSNLDYAVDTQEGIPMKQLARPYLGWSIDDISVVDAVTRTYLEKGRFN